MLDCLRSDFAAWPLLGFITLLFAPDPQYPASQQPGIAKQDIQSGQNNLQQRAREIELRYRQLTENCPLGFSIHENGRFVYVNEVMLQLFGFSSTDEMLGMSAVDFIVPEQRETARRRNSILEGSICSLDAQIYDFIRADGSTFKGEIYPTSIEIDGRPAVQSMIIDVSGRHEQQQRLAESEERYRGLTENSPLAISIQAEGRVRFANARMAQLFGYESPEEMIGLPVLDLFRTEYHNIAHDRYLRMLQSQEGLQAQVIGFQRRDGSSFTGEIHSRPVSFGGEQAIQSLITDVTERIETQLRMEISEQRFSDYIARSSEAIWRVDLAEPVDTSLPREEQLRLMLTGAVLAECNLHFAQRLGFREPVEITGRPFADILPDSGLLEELAGLLLDNDYVLRDRIRVAREVDGRDRFLEENITCIIREGMLISLWGNSRNVTDRIEARRKLERSEERYRDMAALSSEAIWRIRYDPPVPVDLPAEEQARLIRSNGYLSDCNDLMARMYGLREASQVRGRRISELMQECGLSMALNRAIRFIGNGHSFQEEQVELRYPDGSRRIYLDNAQGVVENGMLVEARGTSREITELMHIQEELQNSEQRFRLLVDKTLEGIWCIEYDPPVPVDLDIDQLVECFAENGILAECNEQMATLYGVDSADQIRGRPVSEIRAISRLQRNPERVRRLVSEGFLLRDELLKLDYEDGSSRIYLYNAEGEIVNGELVRIWGTSRDLTDSLNLQEQLRQNEERFKLAVDGAQLGTWDWDIRRDKARYSDRGCEILGLDQDLSGGQELWTELLLPEDSAELRTVLQRHLDGESEFFEAEHRLERPDGSIIWIHNRGKVIMRDADGLPLRAIGMLMDVSARKHADVLLVTSEGRLRNLVSRSTEAIGSVRFEPPLPLDVPEDELRRRLHFDARMMDCNDLMARLYGMERAEQVIGLKMPEIFARSPITSAGNMIDIFIQRGFLLENELLTIEYADGSRRWYLYNIDSEILDGNLQALWATCRDVTDQMEIKERLRESEQRYELAINAGGLGTWDLDIASGRVICNDRFAAMLGFERDNLTWNFDTWIRSVHPADRRRVLAEIRRVIHGDDDVFEVEQRLRHRRGYWIWTLSRGKVISRDEQGRALRALGTELEITERKHAEEQLRVSEQRYREFVVNSTQILWCIAFESPVPTDLSVEEQVQRILRDGFIEDCNDMFARSWGFGSAAELIGRSVMDASSGMDMRSTVELIHRFVASNYVLSDAINHVVLPDGRERYSVSNVTGTLRNESLLRVWGATSEMTDLMLARRRLEESELRYREFVANSSEAIWRYDCIPPIPTDVPAAEQARMMFAQLTIAECNDVFARIYGYEYASEMIGLRLEDFIPVNQGILEMMERFARNGYRIIDDENLLKEHGPEVNYFLNSAQGTVSDGSLVMVWGTTRDVTAQRHATLALADSERQLSSMMQMSPVGIFHLAADGNVIYMNPRAEELFGLDVASCREGGFLAAVHPGDRERVETESRRMVEQGSSLEGEVRLVRGERISWVITQINPVRDGLGRLSGFVGMLTDITDRKVMENSLADSEKRNRELIHTMAEGMILVGDDNHISFLNPNGSVIFGRSTTEMYGHTINEFVADRLSEEELERQQANRRAGLTSTYDMDIMRPDGNRRRIRMTATPQFDDHGRYSGALGTFQDITETQQLALQLQQAQKMEAVGVLAGGIAHDFNNILQAMLGFADIAGDQLDPASEAAACLTEIRAAGSRAADLVRQMLTFSRQSEQTREPVNLSAIVHESVGLLRGSLPSTISIVTKISETDTILGNETQMQQVLMNLSTNAFHAMREHGGELHISCSNTVCSPTIASELGLATGSPMVHLRVADSGHGMDEQTASRVFDPYFTTKRVGEGTGLGLATVHGIVRSMGGWISIESEPERGTAVVILIPAMPEHERPRVQRQARSQPARGSERVMVVDDEPGIAQMLKTGLTRLGYEAVVFTDSRDAWTYWQESGSEVDVVVTDQTMPHMTGDELCRRILEERPELPVLLCTGYSELIDEKGAAELGISRFVNKPVIPSRLAELIRESIDERRPANS
ncbi:PAS domain S-box protein [bacterium]|nr:PAS domain S-box protein [bacterium]